MRVMQSRRAGAGAFPRTRAPGLILPGSFPRAGHVPLRTQDAIPGARDALLASARAEVVRSGYCVTVDEVLTQWWREAGEGGA
jgi:hypothetical protein